MMQNRSILVTETDTHGGHKFGLLNPATELWDEDENGEPTHLYHPEPTAMAKLAWKLHEEVTQTAKDVADGSPIHYQQLGDPTHGNVHSEQTIGTRMADQIIIARDNVLPVYELPNLKTVRFIAGTGVHEFGEGSSTLLIAKWLKEKYPDIDTQPVFHGLYLIENLLIDASHHGPGQSKREWLKGNTARYYLKSIIDAHLKSGKRPPDLVLRGHIHQPVNEVITEWIYNQWFESRLVVCPPLSGLTEYARKVTQSAWEIIMGGVIFEIEKRRITDIHFVTKTLDIRTEEKL